MMDVNHVLCPTDLSDISACALLHVAEAVPSTLGPAVAGYLQDLETAAADGLRRVVPAGASEWCEPEARVVTGKPWREIVRAADEHDAGLIVMGAHGHGPLDRLFFGSTAAGVVRHAGCPVLVARPSLGSRAPSAG
jgi:nucleotide-binding universal stress UspA family protein